MKSRRKPGSGGTRAGPPRRARWLRAPALLLILIAGGTPGGLAAEARSERVLPRFSGPLLGGGIGSTDSFAGRRGLIYAFATTDDSAPEMARLAGRIIRDAAGANIAVLAVNRDLEPERVQPFVDGYFEGLPVILDRELSITRKLGVPPGRSALYVIDADGYIISAFAWEPEGILGAAEAYEAELRRVLRLEPLDQSTRPLLGTSPPAPAFELESLAGTTASLEKLRGKVIALVFFLPTCPHCHDALQYLDRLKRKPGYEDLEVVPVSIRNRPFLMREMREDLELELPLYVDLEASTQQSYEHRLGVPDTVLIDRSGRILSRFGGISPRIEAMISMTLRQALGVPNPILLSRSEYSGSGMCQACHRAQHSSWLLTRHAHAYDTLLEHGEERNSECIGCHSVGWSERGGYDLDQPREHLEGVQCENCHGRGGPHQSPDFLAEKGGYAGVCADCHTATHSLNFVFSERLPEVSHAAQLRFANLSLEERRALLEQREHRQRSLFHDADYVGSRACADCHSREFALWQKTPHARALETLEAQKRAGSADCQRCHTTGFEAAGGFPSGGEALGGVGCESCHGPGGAHVGPDARRSGTILGLTDKCDSCVILQICGSCHDDANDPGFEFELEEKLERVRHGSGSAPAGSAAE